MDLSFREILSYASKKSGLKLDGYRESYLRRRIELRMRILGLKDFSDYFKFIKNNESEIDELVNAIAINVTEFMRDRSPFDYFMQKILPELARKRNGILRFWSAGCANGEEPYSIAIAVLETLPNRNFSIYATDIDEDCLKKALEGIYEKEQLKNLSKEHLDKYFEKIGDKYRIKDFVKRHVRFKKHDLTSQEPITKFLDAIFCRNVMIYFDEKQKEKILENFYNALNSGGYLIVGKSESIPKGKFECVSVSEKIYRKV
ncbi:MAG: protein-glutamate O-methyltransferase CheR [Archaeoglobaceae archaeon]|nr:protein-glutamate O-methyltransferase CheR [Archaeoglobaceae archaeon]MDW8128280.1 protein-glutamate O-methyltransferase CheR [Archaeoglobaceae archaeon]